MADKGTEAGALWAGGEEESEVGARTAREPNAGARAGVRRGRGVDTTCAIVAEARGKGARACRRRGG